jgi:hypothetical protein
MIVAIMEEFCLLMQSLAKITLSQDFQDFHIAKPSNPKHMWGLLFKPDACFMKYYM